MTLFLAAILTKIHINSTHNKNLRWILTTLIMEVVTNKILTCVHNSYHIMTVAQRMVVLTPTTKRASPNMEVINKRNKATHTTTRPTMSTNPRVILSRKHRKGVRRPTKQTIWGETTTNKKRNPLSIRIKSRKSSCHCMKMQVMIRMSMAALGATRIASSALRAAVNSMRRRLRSTKRFARRYSYKRERSSISRRCAKKPFNRN